MAPASTSSTPPAWDRDSAPARGRLQALGTAARPLLMLDYDGTLAPFRDNKMDAVPYPGIAERLARIARGRTALAFVSGRPAEELITLLPLAAEAEIWGMHGRQHRLPGGTVRYAQPDAAQKAALDAAENRLRVEGPDVDAAIERKIASVAVHWRAAGEESEPGRRLRRLAEQAFGPYDGRHALHVLPFDGGLELRASDRTKGHAAEDLLRQVPDAAASAFLGDDTTDEDAFVAVNAAGGLTLLVREPPRASQASFSVRPPDGLLGFLDDWIAAAGERTP